MKVAVIGGGIAGLAAAWELTRPQTVPGVPRVDVTVFEASRLGGKLRTTEFCGRAIDEGPDSFITRSPEAIELCAELGMADQLVAPAAGKSMLWWDGRLRPLPDGLMLGAPRKLGGLATGHILSLGGAARAALDLVLPRNRLSEAPSVRDLIAGRFGSQVADRLVDPLVGGIHAGWTGELGAEETVPQILDAARRSRSLLLGLRKIAPVSGVEEPMFLAPWSGMASLIGALVGSLEALEVAFVFESVHKVARRGPSAQGRVVVEAGSTDTFDAVVVAVPAATAADILGRDAAGLNAIPAASVALVTAELAGASLPEGVNGFLVPRGQGRLMTACSFASNKWPNWAQPGRELVRMSTGRRGETGGLELDDEALTTHLLSELGQALGRSPNPTASRVNRWPDAFPQYLPGHYARLAEVEAQLAERLPTVRLAGASFRGSGIPACVASGRRAANQVRSAVMTSLA